MNGVGITRSQFFGASVVCSLLAGNDKSTSRHRRKPSAMRSCSCPANIVEGNHFPLVPLTTGGFLA